MRALRPRADPVLDRRAAHSGDQQAHGPLQFAVQMPAKEIRRSTEVGEILRRGELPLAARFRVAPARTAGRLHKHAELRGVRGGLLVLVSFTVSVFVLVVSVVVVTGAATCFFSSTCSLIVLTCASVADSLPSSFASEIAPLII